MLPQRQRIRSPAVSDIRISVKILERNRHILSKKKGRSQFCGLANRLHILWCLKMHQILRDESSPGDKQSLAANAFQADWNRILEPRSTVAWAIEAQSVLAFVRRTHSGHVR